MPELTQEQVSRASRFRLPVLATSVTADFGAPADAPRALLAAHSATVRTSARRPYVRQCGRRSGRVLIGRLVQVKFLATRRRAAATRKRVSVSSVLGVYLEHAADAPILVGVIAD